MFANLTGFHLIILLGVVVLLFGAAKLPALAKNLGTSARILKKEIATLHDDEPETVAAPRADTAARPESAAPVVAEAAVPDRG